MNSREAGSAPQFSIIIPAYNEAKVIGQCLEALERLDLPRSAFEVILVDNGSTDKTREVAQAHVGGISLTIMLQPGVHISALRNLGAARARGSYFAFLDADCLPPPTWLSNALPLLHGENVGVVGAHYQIPDDSGWVARAWFGEQLLEKQGDVAWVPSGDLIVARSTFAGVHGFNEAIQTNEDCEFCERVRAAGLRIVASVAVAVVHLGTPQTLTVFYRKTLWHATDGLRVFLKELPRLTNARPLLLGLYTLVDLGGVVGGALWGMAGGPRVVPLAFLLALPLPGLLLSFRLALRRRKPAQVIPLTILHGVYGLARAQALVRVQNWFSSQKAPSKI